MRRNRAELSTISLSALDVFASALGVFMILTSVSLPFIFNTSQSVEKNLTRAQLEAEVKLSASSDEAIKKLISTILSLKVEVEELQNFLAQELKKADSEQDEAADLSKKITSLGMLLIQAEENLESIMQAEKTTALIPPIDIMIALDTTGSMTDQLRSLQGGIIYLSRILMKWSESPAIGIIEVMDQCDYANRGKFPLQELNTVALGDLQRFVYSLGQRHTGCNYDVEEGLHLALREALTTSWRLKAEKRVIILISDFPPYPYAMSEVENSVKIFSNSENHAVSVVHPVTAYTTKDHVETMKRLARFGQGEYIDGAGSIIGAIMLAL